MTTRTPKVSVLMTAYNREDFIGEAIESVLANVFEDFELIVVDDCSSDGTVDKVRSYVAQDSRVKLHLNAQNLGDYPNRNRAASLASGVYLKYLDSDNLMYRHGLAEMVDGMERFPEAGWGLLGVPDAERPPPVLISPHLAYEQNFLRRFDYFGRAPDSAIFRRDLFEKVGGFSGNNLIGDLEMWLKLAQHHPLVKLPPHFGWDRVHPNQQKNVPDTYYLRRRMEVILPMLRHPECPLSSEEADLAVRRLRKEVLKTGARRLARGDLSTAMGSFRAYFWRIWK